MVPIHTFSYHVACSWLKQSVKWIYTCMSCEYGTWKHTCVSKSVALWKNILLEFISVFWYLGCPLCFTHRGFVLCLHSTVECCVWDSWTGYIWFISGVCSYPGEKLAVLCAFPNKWAVSFRIIARILLWWHYFVLCRQTLEENYI